jgi:hypothetical protein
MLWIAGPALAADPPLIPMSPELRQFMFIRNATGAAISAKLNETIPAPSK